MQVTEEKIKELKKKVILKGVRNVRRGYEKDEGDRGMYRPQVKLGLERARLLTQSYKMTEGEPMVLRRAKALAYILDNMTIYIQDHERIVGNYAASPSELHIPIEMNWRAFQKAVTEGDAQDLLDGKGKAELDSICSYWNGRSLRDIQQKAFEGCEQLEKYWEYEGTILWTHWYELGIPNYEKLLKKGLSGVIAEAEAKLEEIREAIPFNYVEQKEFLEAVIITLKATIRFAHRFAELARELAVKESDPKRKTQLEEVAVACEWVPENPARTFQEAIQSFWFIHLITRQIEFTTMGIGIRFDLLIGPYYEKDIEEARITKEDALDIMERLWLNFEGFGVAYSQLFSGVYGGVMSLSAMNIGGVDKEGRDVTNDLTYLVLDTAEIMQTMQPSITMRVHKGTPRELLSRATDVIGTGIGYPSLFNDEALIPLFQRWGVPLEDARDYSLTGCAYVEIPGKCMVRRAGVYLMVAKCLWWALHQGVNPKTGEQYGARTPDPTSFTCIEDVINAYLEQVKFFVDKGLKCEHVARQVYKEYMPRPFTSALVDDCIERGQDFRKFEYAHGIANGCLIIGPANAADSLATIKRLVFDDKKMSMRELIDAIDKNWEGYEELHQLILTKVPKYGNDDDYVDMLAKEIHERTEAAVEEFKDEFGDSWHLDGSGVSATYSLGFDTPATPDGRKDGDPFCDSSLAPMMGRDTKGPTSVLASCAKIDAVKCYNQLLNQKFLPQFLRGENKQIFIGYIESWRDLGIPHIQFNVVDRATLLDAQVHPENHQDLIVRVAGYSAYFVDLSKGLQDSIIARAEQTF